MDNSLDRIMDNIESEHENKYKAFKETLKIVEQERMDILSKITVEGYTSDLINKLENNINENIKCIEDFLFYINKIVKFTGSEYPSIVELKIYNNFLKQTLEEIEKVKNT